MTIEQTDLRLVTYDTEAERDNTIFNTQSAIPSVKYLGFNKTTKQYEYYNGNSWDSLSGIETYATEAARDLVLTSPVQGQFVFLTDSSSISFYNGSTWINSASFFNSTQGGIVSPAYDSTEAIAYRYGGMANAGSAAATNNLQWALDDGTIGDEDGAWWGVFQEWNVTPGVKTITSLHSVWAFWASTHIYEYYVDVWREDATEYTLVASSGALSAIGIAGTSDDTTTLASSLSVTIESGETYFIGLRCKRKNTVSSTPWFFRSNGVAFSQTHMRFAVSVAGWNGSTVSKTDAAGSNYVYSSTDVLALYVDYTSVNLVECEISTGTIGRHIIPVPTVSTIDWAVQLQDTVVADANALTVEWSYMGLDQNIAISDTTELDCGDTTAGQNDLISKGNTVNLPDISATGQEGKTFDLIQFVSNTTAKQDLFWQNKHLEPNIHSHVTANAGSYNSTQYTYNTYCFLAISGTATIGKIRVGVRPVIPMGDSQTYTGSGVTLRSPISYRLGGIIDSLTKDRILIQFGESGATRTVIYSTILTGTAGSNDGKELARFDTTWMFCGVGLNDISAYATTGDNDALEICNLLINVWASLLYILEIQDKAEVVLIGLPPYSAALADEYEAKAARWFNRGLLGLALMGRYVFVNPWPSVVESGTEDDTIPTFDSTYTEDAGTHYNTAGGTVVKDAVVAAYENGSIDLRDTWD